MHHIILWLKSDAAAIRLSAIPNFINNLRKEEIQTDFLFSCSSYRPSIPVSESMHYLFKVSTSFAIFRSGRGIFGIFYFPANGFDGVNIGILYKYFQMEMRVFQKFAGDF